MTAPITPLLLPRRNSPLSRNDFSKAPLRRQPIERVKAIHGNADMITGTMYRDEAGEDE